jgi:tetratricopeptide (TPR) repeat protein
MDITLCLIVKDEIAYLDRCVNSVRGLVNQVVIIDTGSTDGTEQRARALADVAMSVPFTGDFSAARNAALDRADGSWILFLDADERLPEHQHTPLQASLAAADDDLLGVRLMRYNFFATGGFYTGRELKVFRNHPQIRYRRRINESVSGAIQDLGGRVVPVPVVMNHFGHSRPVAVREAKAHRYLSLMAEHMEHNRDDAVVLGYRGLIERTLGNFDAALDQSAQAVAAGPDLAITWFFRGHVLRSVGDDLGALQAYGHGAKLAPEHAVLRNMIGLQLLALGDADAASGAFHTARRLDPQLLHTDINLGLVAQAEQRWADAARLFLRAGEANDGFWHEEWPGRVERDPFRAFYNETIFGYAGLGYHTGYCLLRARNDSSLSEAVRSQINSLIRGSA